MSGRINRRKFFSNTAVSVTGLMLGAGISCIESQDQLHSSSYNIMEEVMKYRKINAHEHLFPNSNFDGLLDAADRLGMEKLVITGVPSVLALPGELRECNDLVLKAMKQYQDRFFGLVFINPAYEKESLEEIKRCVDQGMIGLKAYHQVKISDLLFYPIIEKFIDLKMIILMHSECGMGVGGKRTKYGNNYPNASTPEDFVEAAKKYPEAMFQYAHTGGGGDWEYAIKAIKDYPNIYIDTSGSNNEGNMIDFALKYLGEDRLFFGTDGSYYQGVGGILASKLNDVQKKKIFFENYNNILRKAGNNVN